MLATAIIVVCNLFGKGMIKIVPVLLGVLGSYIVAACFGLVDFTPVKEAAWIGVPFQMKDTAFAVFANPDWSLIIAAIIVLVTMGGLVVGGESIISHEQRELELKKNWYLAFCVWLNHRIFDKDDKCNYLIVKWN